MLYHELSGRSFSSREASPPKQQFLLNSSVLRLLKQSENRFSALPQFPLALPLLYRRCFWQRKLLNLQENFLLWFLIHIYSLIFNCIFVLNPNEFWFDYSEILRIFLSPFLLGRNRCFQPCLLLLKSPINSSKTPQCQDIFSHITKSLNELLSNLYFIFLHLILNLVQRFLQLIAPFDVFCIGPIENLNVFIQILKLDTIELAQFVHDFPGAFTGHD